LVRSTQEHTLILFPAIMVLLTNAPFRDGVEAAEEGPISEDGTMNDFGFLSDKRTIRHQRLKESMVDSDEWITFETGYEAWDMLEGAASVDRVFGLVDGKPFEGVSVRSHDNETDEWTIYWMDIRNSKLREQVRGRFKSGVGTFHGTEIYRGVSYRMRFLWKDITETTARWEQAYQDPETGDWETNWIMDFYENAE